MTRLEQEPKPISRVDRIIHRVIFGSNGRREAMHRSMWQRFPELGKIPDGRWPQHVFIIPDANRRYEAAMRLTKGMGHEKGAEVMIQAFEDLGELGELIPFVGGWAISDDNVRKRDKEEIDHLMDILKRTGEKMRPRFMERNSRFEVIGREDFLDEYPATQEALLQTVYDTRENTGQTLYIAVGFSGVDQNVRIAQKIAQLVQEGEIKDQTEITAELLASLRDGGGRIPEADIIFRTGGDGRLSDVGWLQGPGTQIYLKDKFWPSTTTKDLVKVLVDFSERDRRFGGRPIQNAMVNSQ